MELYSDGIVLANDNDSQVLFSTFRYADRYTRLEEYVVKEGDNLFSLANKFYNRTRFWWLIAELNPSIDPLLLEIGSTLYIPFYA